MTLTDLYTHVFCFFPGKGKGLNLPESNPSDTEDFIECGGKKGRRTASHVHLYVWPQALTAGLGREPLRGAGVALQTPKAQVFSSPWKRWARGRG